MCFIKQRSVGEHFFLLTMGFYVNQSVCTNHLFSPSCFTDGHEAESKFGMVKRRFAPWRLYSSAECTSLCQMQHDAADKWINKSEACDRTVIVMKLRGLFEYALTIMFLVKIPQYTKITYSDDLLFPLQ